jgi:hypothetical protein
MYLVLIAQASMFLEMQKRSYALQIVDFLRVFGGESGAEGAGDACV